MIATILNRCRRVSDYVFGNQNENVIPDESRSQSQRNIFGSKKRTASAFEPEITDDEDDIGGSSAVYFQPSQSSKRLRSDPDEFAEMSRKCVTQGSGIPPHVEGLEKQPWQFDFNFKRPNPKGQPNIRQPTPSTSGTTAKSGLQQSDRINIQRQTAKIDTNRWLQPSTSAKTGTSRYIPIRVENKSTSESSSLRNKGVEVITIDDDDQRPKSKGEVEIPPSQREMALIKRPVSSPMKKTRDSNRFSRALVSVGRKVMDTARSSVFRLQEMEQYKQLLRKHNVTNKSGNYQNIYIGSALVKSKVGRDSLAAMYKRCSNASPTQGNVTFRQISYSRTPGSNLNKQIVPKLFSTPKDLDAISSPPTSRFKALTYSKLGPEVIDLEGEQENYEASSVEKNLSPIVPYKKVEHTFISPEKKANFSNLEEALHANAMAGPSPSTMGTLPADEEKDEADEDADISIIAERIVAKSRKKCVNTLALEQSSSPYVDKKWLVKSKSEWRERQKQREARIKEEETTMNIIRQESTIDKEIAQRVRDKLTLTEIIVLEEPPPELPELTEDMMKIINYAKMRGNDSEVLAQVRLLKDTIGITRGDIKTLGPSQWLNDNVINTYMGLIVLRGKLDNYPNVYAFQTFFYPKLLKEGYSNSLKRWTRKDDIFAHDLIILPIHLGLHWCLACIDLRRKTIKYFDSLGGDNNKCLHSLLDYLSREMKERKQVDLTKSEWKLENVKGIPQQQNGSDCGMFACKFAEYLSRDADFSFTQENMPYYRNRMIYELLEQDLLYP